MADIFLIAGTHRSYQPGDLLPRVRGHPWRGRQALRLGAAPGIIIDETCHCSMPQCPQGHLLNCVDTAGDCLTGLVMLTHNILVTASGTGLSCFKAKKVFNKNLSQALVSWCGTWGCSCQWRSWGWAAVRGWPSSGRAATRSLWPVTKRSSLSSSQYSLRNWTRTRTANIITELKTHTIIRSQDSIFIFVGKCVGLVRPPSSTVTFTRLKTKP